MKFYMLRNKETGEWVSRHGSSVNRIFERAQYASNAASHLCEHLWNKNHDKRWWSLSTEERREYRRQLLDVVMFEVDDDAGVVV